jgi:hypothetical protein
MEKAVVPTCGQNANGAFPSCGSKKADSDIGSRALEIIMNTFKSSQNAVSV